MVLSQDVDVFPWYIDVSSRRRSCDDVARLNLAKWVWQPDWKPTTYLLGQRKAFTHTILGIIMALAQGGGASSGLLWFLADIPVTMQQGRF
jgi:hypothetical protein